MNRDRLNLLLSYLSFVFFSAWVATSIAKSLQSSTALYLVAAVLLSLGVIILIEVFMRKRAAMAKQSELIMNMHLQAANGLSLEEAKCKACKIIEGFSVFESITCGASKPEYFDCLPTASKDLFSDYTLITFPQSGVELGWAYMRPSELKSGYHRIGIFTDDVEVVVGSQSNQVLLLEFHWEVDSHMESFESIYHLIVYFHLIDADSRGDIG